MENKKQYCILCGAENNLTAKFCCKCSESLNQKDDDLQTYAKNKVKLLGGSKIKIGIIEESTILKNWYIENGFVHTGIKKFDHLPFTSGYLEWIGD